MTRKRMFTLLLVYLLLWLAYHNCYSEVHTWFQFDEIAVIVPADLVNISSSAEHNITERRFLVPCACGKDPKQEKGK